MTVWQRERSDAAQHVEVLATGVVPGRAVGDLQPGAHRLRPGRTGVSSQAGVVRALAADRHEVEDDVVAHRQPCARPARAALDDAGALVPADEGQLGDTMSPVR